MNGARIEQEKLSARQQELLQPLFAGGAPAGGAGAADPRRAPAPHHPPVSFAQQRLWFLQELMPESPYYNMPRAIRFAGRLEPEALARALNELVRRHEALRTTFAEATASRQVVAESLTVAVAAPRPRRPGGGGEPEAVERIGLAFVAPFDLARGPLLRDALLRLGRGRARAAPVHPSHRLRRLVAGVLVRELVALYAAPPPAGRRRAAAGAAHPVRRLRALAARTGSKGEVLDAPARLLAARSSPARRRCSSCPPTGRARRCRPCAARTAPAAAPPASPGAARGWPRGEGATLFMVLLAGLPAPCSPATPASDDLVVGTPIANRQPGGDSRG